MKVGAIDAQWPPEPFPAIGFHFVVLRRLRPSFSDTSISCLTMRRVQAKAQEEEEETKDKNDDEYEAKKSDKDEDEARDPWEPGALRALGNPWVETHGDR